MRPRPSIALKLLAGSTSLALSVRGWHSPEMAVLGAGLFLRAGFDLERKRPTNGPPIPLRPAPGPPPAGPAPPGGRAAWSEGAYRVAAWATRDRGTDPAQVHLDREWRAAQLQQTSATAAASAPTARHRPSRPPPPANQPATGRSGSGQPPPASTRLATPAERGP